jgi:ABC-type nitrate/sulfonate/bicarbonate transport system substrate-binding protein
MLAAFDALREEQNIDIEFVQFEGGDQSARALASGEVDFGRTTPVPLMGLAKDSNVKLFVTLKQDEWALVCAQGISTPEQLSGKRIARHAPNDVTAALVNNTINKYEVTPELLTIPGSENRVIALLQGEIDCSPVDIGGIFVLESERPGGFNQVLRYNDEIPGVIYAGLTAVNTDRVDADRETWETVTEYIVKFHRMAMDDPEWLATQADEYFPDVSHDLHLQQANAYRDFEGFTRDGGVDVEAMTRLMQFYVDAGAMDAGALLPYDEYATPELVQAALEKLGD